MAQSWSGHLYMIESKTLICFCATGGYRRIQQPRCNCKEYCGESGWEFRKLLAARKSFFLHESFGNVRRSSLHCGYRNIRLQWHCHWWNIHPSTILLIRVCLLNAFFFSTSGLLTYDYDTHIQSIASHIHSTELLHQMVGPTLYKWLFMLRVLFTPQHDKSNFRRGAVFQDSHATVYSLYSGCVINRVFSYSYSDARTVAHLFRNMTQPNRKIRMPV